MKRYIKITLIRSLTYYGSGTLTLKLASRFIQKYFSISLCRKQIMYLLKCFGLGVSNIKTQEQRDFWRDVFDDLLSYGIY